MNESACVHAHVCVYEREREMYVYVSFGIRIMLAS